MEKHRTSTSRNIRSPLRERIVNVRIIEISMEDMELQTEPKLSVSSWKTLMPFLKI